MHDRNENLALRSHLSPTKRAFLELRLRGQVPVKTKTHGIPRRPGGIRTPLSFGRQRLWFLHQMAPQSAVYNVPVALRVEGVLNSSALEQAFSEIVRCHELLRTTFDMVDSEPVQVISPPYRVVLPIVDLKALGKTGKWSGCGNRPLKRPGGPLIWNAVRRGTRHLGDAATA